MVSSSLLAPVIGLLAHEGIVPPRHDAESPVKAQLSLLPTPRLGEKGDLTAIVSSDIESSNAIAEVGLEDGFSLITGQLKWSGSISRGQSFTVLSSTIAATKLGNWTIRLSVKLFISRDSWVGAEDRLYVAIGSTISQQSHQLSEVKITAPRTFGAPGSQAQSTITTMGTSQIAGNLVAPSATPVANAGIRAQNPGTITVKGSWSG